MWLLIALCSLIVGERVWCEGVAPAARGEALFENDWIAKRVEPFARHGNVDPKFASPDPAQFIVGQISVGLNKVFLVRREYHRHNAFTRRAYRDLVPVRTSETTTASFEIVYRGFATVLYHDYGFNGFHRWEKQVRAIDPQIALQLSPSRVFRQGDLLGGNVCVSLRNLKCFSLLDVSLARFPARTSFKEQIEAIAPPSLLEGTRSLPDRDDQAYDGCQTKRSCNDGPRSCPPRFMRCFFSSYGGAPLSAQIGSVVVLGFIAGIGIVAGIGREFSGWASGSGWRWRRGRLRRSGGLFSALAALALFGWLLSGR